jgi:hypothetical protein
MIESHSIFVIHIQSTSKWIIKSFSATPWRVKKKWQFSLKALTHLFFKLSINFSIVISSKRTKSNTPTSCSRIVMVTRFVFISPLFSFTRFLYMWLQLSNWAKGYELLNYICKRNSLTPSFVFINIQFNTLFFTIICAKLTCLLRKKNSSYSAYWI